MTEPAVAAVAFFTGKDGAYEPGLNARSLQDGGLQSGNALGGLLAHTLLESGLAENLLLARFTVDFLGPASTAPLRADWRRLRDGRRTAVREGTLKVAEREVARATALLVRPGDGPPAASFVPPSPPPEGASPVMPSPQTGLEARLVGRGAVGGAEPTGRLWVRQLAPIVAGAAPHPLVAAVLAAGLAGARLAGVGPEVSSNVDVAIHFVRPARGAWILAEAEALWPGEGGGVVTGQLSDRQGLFAQLCQTLAGGRAGPTGARP